MKRAHCLDVLRILASVALALGHLTAAPLMPKWLSELLLGGLSSATFFILSGFVVVSSSSFRLLAAMQTFWKRTARLLPAHWVGIALVLPAEILGAGRMPMDELLKVLAWWLPGMQNFASMNTFFALWNPPAWAVTPFVVGGALFALLKVLKVSQWGLRAHVGLLGLTVMVRIGMDLIPEVPADYTHQLMRHMALIPRLLEILMGALAGFALAGRSPQWMRKDSSLAISFVTAVGLLVAAGEMGGKQGIFLYTHGIYAPVGLALVACAYWNDGWLERIANRRWVEHGGRISIFFWLTHVPVNSLLKKSGYRMGMSLDQLNEWWVVLLSLVLTIALASFCERIIRFPRSTERPTLESRAHAAG